MKEAGGIFVGSMMQMEMVRVSGAKPEESE
jgi:hypothetical protein